MYGPEKNYFNPIIFMVIEEEQTTQWPKEKVPPPSGRFWLSCLGPLVVLLPKH
jgi:hypothetical protein